MRCGLLSSDFCLGLGLLLRDNSAKLAPCKELSPSRASLGNMDEERQQKVVPGETARGRKMVHGRSK